MNQTATVHARLDRKTKEASEMVLQEIGMTPTEAVRLLYRQIAMRQEFPLELRVPNAHTARILDQSDRNEEVEYFDSADDLKKSWAR
ncbi:MAG: type II toxin-antitoxin system RelB/DinJ family antitoxin [Verrucomicrobia bacterium]|nr:type II toxin-antitoxin system RelB/DinJ family antitoxin [Verrucomicrobiota bacterium]